MQQAGCWAPGTHTVPTAGVRALRKDRQQTAAGGVCAAQQRMQQNPATNTKRLGPLQVAGPMCPGPNEAGFQAVGIHSPFLPPGGRTEVGGVGRWAGAESTTRSQQPWKPLRGVQAPGRHTGWQSRWVKTTASGAGLVAAACTAGVQDRRLEGRSLSEGPAARNQAGAMPWGQVSADRRGALGN